jgi:hypothetical protein
MISVASGRNLIRLSITTEGKIHIRQAKGTGDTLASPVTAKRILRVIEAVKQEHLRPGTDDHIYYGHGSYFCDRLPKDRWVVGTRSGSFEITGIGVKRLWDFADALKEVSKTARMRGKKNGR